MRYEIHHGGNSLNNVANLHALMAIRNTRCSRYPAGSCPEVRARARHRGRRRGHGASTRGSRPRRRDRFRSDRAQDDRRAAEGEQGVSVMTSRGPFPGGLHARRQLQGRLLPPWRPARGSRALGPYIPRRDRQPRCLWPPARRHGWRLFLRLQNRRHGALGPARSRRRLHLRAGHRRQAGGPLPHDLRQPHGGGGAFRARRGTCGCARRRTRRCGSSIRTPARAWSPGSRAKAGIAAVEGGLAVVGVSGSGAPVRLDFLDPGGAGTGRLLPSGAPCDVFDVPGLGRVDVSLVDAGESLRVRARRAIRRPGRRIACRPERGHDARHAARADPPAGRRDHGLRPHARERRPQEQSEGGACRTAEDCALSDGRTLPPTR